MPTVSSLVFISFEIMHSLSLAKFVMDSSCFLNDVVIIWFCFTSWSADWGPNIDIVGFCFLDLASNYEPPKSLVDWLEEGENPIYVGFGSLVSFFNCIFKPSDHTDKSRECTVCLSIPFPCIICNNHST
jgi:hypothetical protein